MFIRRRSRYRLEGGVLSRKQLVLIQGKQVYAGLWARQRRQLSLVFCLGSIDVLAHRYATKYFRLEASGRFHVRSPLAGFVLIRPAARE